MKANKSKWLCYENKVCLAPMVRVGTLPMRLLALRYGADIVYSEELIDLKLLKSKRVTNDVLNTVDFIDPTDGTVIFRTCQQEKNKVVLQLGTSDALRALAVGRLVQHDIAGLDVNMGCPKEFSIKGGMGVALLSQPEKAAHILETLSNNLDIPVTCKIRILPDLEDTMNLVRKLGASGIAAIAIHGRTSSERPQHSVHTDVISEIAKISPVPVIANGGSRDIRTHDDIHKFREVCGAKSVMIARAAQLNVSIFRKQGLLPIDEVITEYLKLSVIYDNAAHNTKYCVQSMLKEQQETPRGKRFLQCQTLQQICNIWKLDEYFNAKQIEYENKGYFGRREAISDDQLYEIDPKHKRRKIDECENNNDAIIYNIAFLRSNYKQDAELPKTILHTYCKKMNLDIPNYTTQQKGKLFRSICTHENKKFTSSFWEKNKRQAEQGAALSCLLYIGLCDKNELVVNGSLKLS